MKTGEVQDSSKSSEMFGGNIDYENLTDEQRANLERFANVPVTGNSLDASRTHQDNERVNAALVRLPMTFESIPDKSAVGENDVKNSDVTNRENVLDTSEHTPGENEYEGEKLLNKFENGKRKIRSSQTFCCFKIKRGKKTERWPPKFCCRDLILGLISFFTFGFDYGTDIRLMIDYITDGEYTLFALTCGFIVVPSFISGIISVIWYKMTYRRDKQLGYKRAKRLYYARIWLSFVQLGRLFRQGEYLYNVFHSLREQKKGNGNSKEALKYRKRAMEEKRDAAILGLIDGFMESALQLILQLYLSIYLNLPGNFSRVSSLVSSWVSTSLIVTTYYRANRKAVKDKQNMDYFSSFFYFLWKFTELGPRYILLAITGAFFQPWCFIFLPVHIIFVFILLMQFKPDLSGLCTMPTNTDKLVKENLLESDTQTDQKSDGCTFKFSKILQYLFVFVMSFIGIFTYINLKEGRTWTITAIYYVVYYVENITMAALFLYLSVSTDNVTGWTYSLFVLPAGILCHTLFAGIYYGCFHPNHWNKQAPSISFRCCC